MRLSYFPQLLRITLGFVLLGLFGLRGAHGQGIPHDIRIGLRVKQREVRLVGLAPVRVEAPGSTPLTLPAGQTLVIQPANGGISLKDSAGTELLAATTPLRVVPVISTDATVTPLIQLLGPTRHYDGKPDRPYRGAMELLLGADGLAVVNVVAVEDYLKGVVSSEMRCSYPLEALKAQAVAARTYALKNVGRFADQGFDLDDTARSQVYGGYFSEDPRTTQAVTETAGKVLTYDNQLISAVYSSTCGGYTESAEEAWGRKVPYLTSVPDFEGTPDGIVPHPVDEAGWAAYCKSWHDLNCLQPKFARPEVFRWVRALTRKDLEASLPADQQVGTVMNIIPLHRGASGRITALRIDGSARSVTLQTELTIRHALGNLRSSAFTVDIYRDDAGKPVIFLLWGAGWGHGLGMCQVGAVGLASQGWKYDAILAHYYQGTALMCL